jgi:DNA repair protein RadC
MADADRSGKFLTSARTPVRVDSILVRSRFAQLLLLHAVSSPRSREPDACEVPRHRCRMSGACVGIGGEIVNRNKAKAVKAYRLELIRTKIAEPAPTVCSAADVARRYAHLEKYDREHLVRLDLDNQNRLIGEETVSIGTADASLVSVREVFKGALLNGAVRIIVLHQHPGGNPEPSAEDRVVEKKLVDAGEILGVPVMDFLIIGENGRFWCRQDGDDSAATAKDRR